VTVARDHRPVPWAHRPWCAPDCGFVPGVAEGTHLGRAWTLTPDREQPSRVALRLFERVGEDTRGEVGVLLSVTERRLAGDLDPLGEGSGPAVEGGLADITSAAGLTAQETARLFETLVAFASWCDRPEEEGAARGDSRS
jgi:hypothetical protein